MLSNFMSASVLAGFLSVNKMLTLSCHTLMLKLPQKAAVIFITSVLVYRNKPAAKCLPGTKSWLNAKLVIYYIYIGI